MKEIQGLKMMKKKNCQKNANQGHSSQYNSGLAWNQQPFKSLLYGNRSLKLLFDASSAIRQHSQIERRLSNQFKIKSGLMTTQLTKFNNQKYNQRKSVSVAKDQYLLIYKKPSEKKSKQKDSLKHKKEELVKFKAIPKLCRRSEVPQQDKRFASTSYDPESYNWRKDFHRQKNDRPKQPNLLSSKMCASEYYGDQLERKSKKQTQEGNNLREYTTQSAVLDQKGQCRSRSTSARPKVVKNVFQIRSNKAKHQPLSPKKSFEFTFGI